MLKRYHHIIGNLFRFLDACVIGGVWLGAYWLRFFIPMIPWLPHTKGFPPFSQYAALCPLMMILWMIIFTVMRVYQSSRILRRTHEVYLILKAHMASLLVFIALTYLFSEYKYSRGVVLYFGTIGAISLILLRIVLRNTLRAFRKRGFNLRYLLILGEGTAVKTLIEQMNQFPELGLRIIGIMTHPESSLQSIQNKPVLGSFDQLKKILQQYKPDQVLVSLPNHQHTELDSILKQLKDETIDIYLIPDIYQYITLGCNLEDFNGLPIVHLNDCPLNGWSFFTKRATDIILSALTLVFLSPLFLLIALVIKLTSKGPIFFLQERMGLDGKTFQMIKFRSMHIHAEQETGAVWADRNDTRKTSVGIFLRKTSLDELPQFWNVFRGEMSLVGPRPERPIFVQQFRQDIPLYMLRHKVKSGITGWAQINGWRGNTSLNRRIEYDLYYIRNWSYFFDWKILLMTLWKGFMNKNAY